MDEYINRSGRFMRVRRVQRIAKVLIIWRYSIAPSPTCRAALESP